MKRFLPSVLAGVLLCLLGGLAWAGDGLGPIRSGFTQAVADARYLLLSGGTVTGQTTYTADPASTAVASTTLLSNPATCAANEPLLGVAVAGSTRFSADCEGDVSVAGLIAGRASAPALTWGLIGDRNGSLNVGDIKVFDQGYTGGAGLCAVGNTAYFGNGSNLAPPATRRLSAAGLRAS